MSQNNYSFQNSCCKFTTLKFIYIGTNRIKHWFLMQTEKSQSEGQQIMPETRLTEFLALSVDLGVGIS